MSIRPAAGAQIRELIAAVEGKDAVARDAAVARLAVIGPRAMEPLLQSYARAGVRLRAGILRAFEASGDARALPSAREAIRGDAPDLHAPAAGALRALLASTDAKTATAALDELVAAAVDPGVPTSARVAALDALRDGPPDVMAQLAPKLQADPDAAVR